MKVILIGYMASGKSTIGKILSQKLDVKFIDLDDYIEEKEKRTITTIFKEEGEIYFRLKENEYLKELLHKNENFVLSLGGGTPCYANNINVISSNNSTTSIYLKATIGSIINRLQNNKTNRPLLANLSEKELVEFIAKHLFERSFFYEQANVKVKTDNKTITEVVEELLNVLN